jgi:hypothetical protein
MRNIFFITFLGRVRLFAVLLCLLPSLSIGQTLSTPQQFTNEHVLSQDTRLEALQMLQIIQYFDKGNIQGICEYAEGALKLHSQMLRPGGLEGVSEADRKKNEDVYKIIEKYFQREKRCSLGDKSLGK